MKKLYKILFLRGEGGNFPGGNFPEGHFSGEGAIFLGGLFPGGNFLEGIFPGGFFPGGIFPDTVSNLMKDNEVPVHTFPPIVNWQLAFLLLHHMPIP